MTHDKAEQATNIALDYFAQRFNCAEAVLLGLVEAFDLDRTCAPRIATGFGGGMGGCGEVCGALVGALMAFGLKFGRERPDDLDAKVATGARARDLLRAFEAEFGTIQCIGLTHCDMTTPEGMAKAQELDLHNKLCPKFVKFAAREASRLLDN